MHDTEVQPQLPPGLRFLKALVTTLMITMIVGVITVVWVLVTRMPKPINLPALPAALALPEGATPMAITQGPGWIAVVTTGSRILVFHPDGTLAQDIAVTLP